MIDLQQYIIYAISINPVLYRFIIMRSAVQSCVPLQESTAKRCVFFVYSHQACPEGAGHCRSRAVRARSQRTGWDNDRKGAKRPPAWWGRSKKSSQRFPTWLSWVQSEWTERIRRSPSGDWNILRPASWKSSTYEIFVSAFFILGNFRGTWKFWISFSFHYFHR